MDLIDRQAAIDALEDIGSLDTEADRKYARSVFETLPSAQPGSSFITWLLDEIWDEDMWELNWQAFPEVLCRKMAKLGYIRERNGEYERLDRQTGGD